MHVYIFTSIYKLVFVYVCYPSVCDVVLPLTSLFRLFQHKSKQQTNNNKRQSTKQHQHKYNMALHRSSIIYTYICIYIYVYISSKWSYSMSHMLLDTPGSDIASECHKLAKKHRLQKH